MQDSNLVKKRDSFSGPQSSASENGHTKALEETIALQAKKIQLLLQQCESTGAEAHLPEEERRLYVEQIQNLQSRVEQTKRWEDLGLRRLGPDLESANRQIDHLWNHVHALNSPAHRAIAYSSKLIGSNFLFVRVRSFLRLLRALREA